MLDRELTHRAHFWLAGLALLLAGCAARGMQMQESPWLRTLERKSGLIAYVGMDANLYTINQAGDKQHLLAEDGELAIAIGGAIGVNPYTRPFAWSPDGTELAYIEYSEVAWLIKVSDAQGETQRELLAVDNELPRFLGWWPDGNALSLLTQVDPAQTGGAPLFNLWLAPVGGARPTVIFSTPQIFYAPEPFGSRVVAHVTEPTEAGALDRVVLITEGNAVPRDLELSPAGFMAPAWSPDGLGLLYPMQDEQGVNQLAIANLQGQARQIVARFDTAIAFSWSPDGKYIAYIDSAQARMGALGLLTVVEVSTGQVVFTTPENRVHGFFWSPDSGRIVYFTKEVAAADEQQSTLLGALAIHFLDVKEGEVLDYAVDNTPFQFRPTVPFLEMLTKFDLYSRFATIWSPNGEKIVLPMVTADGQGVIYILATSGNLAPRPIVEGVMAFWSPR